MTFYLDKDHASLGEVLINYGLAKISVSKIEKTVSVGMEQWQPHLVESLKKAGFEISVEGHRLGLKLEK